IAGAEVYLRDVIHSLDDPIYPEGATAVLTGNLAPRGCVMKPAAADQRFLKHRGPALAFEDYNHMAREIERDDLAATPDHVIVLKNAGPKGGPGMPEWGMLPIPKKLVQAGVRDMVRISDGRMSGTSYGACILHVSPARVRFPNRKSTRSSTAWRGLDESRTFRPRRARPAPACDLVRRAPYLRQGGGRGRHLLPARGGAPRNAAQHGAGARGLSRRAGARNEPPTAR